MMQKVSYSEDYISYLYERKKSKLKNLSDAKDENRFNYVPIFTNSSVVFHA